MMNTPEKAFLFSLLLGILLLGMMTPAGATSQPVQTVPDSTAGSTDRTISRPGTTERNPNRNFTNSGAYRGTDGNVILREGAITDNEDGRAQGRKDIYTPD